MGKMFKGIKMKTQMKSTLAKVFTKSGSFASIQEITGREGPSYDVSSEQSVNVAATDRKLINKNSSIVRTEP